MAIKKRDDKDLKLSDRTKGDEVSAPSLTQLRSEELPCVVECPRRSLLFLREHTHLRRDPAMITCPNCLQGVETVVERRCTNTTHFSALLLLPVCFCALPYCSKMLRDSLHRCPSCGIALGAHFASIHDAFTCGIGTRQDRHGEGRCAATSGEAQFF